MLLRLSPQQSLQYMPSIFNTPLLGNFEHNPNKHGLLLNKFIERFKLSSVNIAYMYTGIVHTYMYIGPNGSTTFD